MLHNVTFGISAISPVLGFPGLHPGPLKITFNLLNNPFSALNRCNIPMQTSN